MVIASEKSKRESGETVVVKEVLHVIKLCFNFFKDQDCMYYFCVNKNYFEIYNYVHVLITNKKIIPHTDLGLKILNNHSFRKTDR